MIKEIKKSWFFVIGIIFVYLVILSFNLNLFLNSMGFFVKIILKIIPIFIFIFILMTLTNYFITPKFVAKHLKDKGIKKWIYIIFGGILSSGPIYMWFPFLGDLKKKGLTEGLIACFLYNRAIKISLIPLAIFYFNWKFIAILFIVMVFTSIIQGILINKLMEVKK